MSQSINPSDIATEQYMNSTSKLNTRIAIHSYSTNPQSWFEWLGERLNPKITGQILEVGAGTGEIWRHIDSSRAEKLTLTDFSPAMCNSLKALQKSIPKIQIQQCDAAKLPFPDGSFDCLIANHMLYHIDDPDSVLQEFARVLRPKGTLIVSLSGRNNMGAIVDLSTHIESENSIIPTFGLKKARIVAETATEYLSKYFANISEERFPGDLEIPTSEPVLAYFKSFHGADGVQESDILRIKTEVESRIATDGSFKVKKHLVLFIATRPEGNGLKNGS